MNVIAEENNQSEFHEEKELEKEIEYPKIFVVQTQRGREIQLLFLIKERIRVKGLKIRSAWILRDQDRVVFIEADDYRDVIDAIRGFPYTVLLSYSPLPLQEAKQFLDKLLIRKPEVAKEIKLEPGVWVKITGGVFRGKRGRIVSIEKKRVLVELSDLPGFPVEVTRDDIEPLPESEIPKKT